MTTTKQQILDRKLRKMIAGTYKERVDIRLIMHAIKGLSDNAGAFHRKVYIDRALNEMEVVAKRLEEQSPRVPHIPGRFYTDVGNMLHKSHIPADDFIAVLTLLE